MTSHSPTRPDRFDRVLLVHNRYRQRAGEDRVFDAEVELLRDRGHEVLTYVLDNRDLDGRGGPGVAARAVWNRRSHREIGDLVRRHRPDVAHFHNVQPQVSPAGYHAAAGAGVPVVQTLHNYRLACVSGALFRDGHVCNDCVGHAVAWRGVVHRCYRGSLGGSATVAAATAAHRALGTWTSKIDAYIALSQFSRAKFVAAGLPAERVMVKPNFLSGVPSARRGDEGYVLYAGRLSAEKGIDTLIAAWERAPAGLELRIAGDGPLADRVKVAAQRDPSFTWLGDQTHDEVLTLLGAARAAIVPSACYENFPMAILEAGAAGVPCIASGHGALAELIAHGETGLLFAPGDAAALAGQLARAAAEPALMAALGETARQRFSERFSAEKNYAELIDIYTAAARRSAERRGAAAR